MIISASRRTDIPSFYGKWFQKRIEEGYFLRINPFNSKQVRVISLLPSDIDLIVLWSKDPKPFFQYLDYLDNMGYNYYFQFTLNDYPKIFEPFVPSVEERILTFQELASRIGRQKVIWRYDPIIISSITNADYHLQKIYNISNRLKDHTNRLIISFLDFYGKVKNRLYKLMREEDIELIDIIDINYRDDLFILMKEIKKISDEFKLDIFTCAEMIDLDEVGIGHASCIDIELIRKLFNIEKNFPKDKNQRKECLCAESVDMGVYDTCQFQCNYCYANSNATKIRNNVKKHRPDNPTLIGLDLQNIEIQPYVKKNKLKDKQASLLK